MRKVATISLNSCCKRVPDLLGLMPRGRNSAVELFGERQLCILMTLTEQCTPHDVVLCEPAPGIDSYILLVRCGTSA
jgi:hypothetical protein